MTPQIDLSWKSEALLWGFQHTSLSFLTEIDGKMFIFRVNLRIWHLKLIVLEKSEHCSKGFNTHLWVFWEGRWETMFIFQSKPRHVTPQIDLSWKKEDCSKGFNTHLWGFLRKIDGKTFIFQVNLSMWPLKLIVLEKRALFWGFQHTFILRRSMGKCSFFRVNLGMWPLKSIVS